MVHEGFSASAVVRKVSQTCNNMFAHTEQISVLRVHLDVTEYGNLAELSKLLHFWLMFGYIMDDTTGAAFILPAHVSLRIFVELPALSPDGARQAHSWPPAADAGNAAGASWSTASHPMLQQLPVLVVACSSAPNGYVTVRNDAPYIMDGKANLVAKYLQMLERGNLDLQEQVLPASQHVQPTEAFPALLNNLFASSNIPASKALRSQFISILCDR